MRRIIRKLALVFFILLYCCSEKNKTFQDPIYVNTIDGPIEFHGLKKWTIADIEKAINHAPPGESLQACAQILENDFDFPEASVILLMDLLVKTDIDPTLGKELLSINYEIVYSYLLCFAL